MDDYAEFRRKALDALPDNAPEVQHLRASNLYFAGVLKHDATSDNITCDSFQWYNCKASTKVARMIDNYKTFHGLTDQIVISIDDLILSESEKVKSLPDPDGSHIIIARASLLSDTDNLAAEVGKPSFTTSQAPIAAPAREPPKESAAHNEPGVLKPIDGNTRLSTAPLFNTPAKTAPSNTAPPSHHPTTHAANETSRRSSSLSSVGSRIASPGSYSQSPQPYYGMLRKGGTSTFGMFVPQYQSGYQSGAYPLSRPQSHQIQSSSPIAVDSLQAQVVPNPTQSTYTSAINAYPTWPWPSHPGPQPAHPQHRIPPGQGAIATQPVAKLNQNSNPAPRLSDNAAARWTPQYGLYKNEIGSPVQKEASRESIEGSNLGDRQFAYPNSLASDLQHHSILPSPYNHGPALQSLTSTVSPGHPVPSVSEIDAEAHDANNEGSETDEAEIYIHDDDDVGVRIDSVPTRSRDTLSNNLHALSQNTEADALELGVKEGLAILQRLQASIDASTLNNSETRRYIDSIRKVASTSVDSRTVVGVVGNTGSGKSSVVNAVLEEERLLPTSTMRACTAVVTSVAFNRSQDPKETYRAEIEFIDKESWEKDLTIALEELINDEGKVVYTGDSSSEAGVAWAKVKAVYPNITKDTLAAKTVDGLMKDAVVAKLFGSVEKFARESIQSFYPELQSWIDSADKQTTVGGSHSREYWPLIKEVRLFVKADVLSTGAVLVDLPGVQDSNAARAAVAGNYLKQCSRLWVVAPIVRAVDDKAAKNLLGDRFKRQLKYDGTLDCVTFVCSKIDDINITEASEDIPEKAEVKKLEQQIRALEQQARSLQDQKKTLVEDKVVMNSIYKEQDAQLDLWGSLLDQIQDGDVVYPPREKKCKRAASPRQQKSRKTSRTGDLDEDDAFIISDDEDAIAASDEENDDLEADESKPPLTEEEAKQKKTEAKAAKMQARAEELDLGKKIKELATQVKELDLQINQVDAEIYALCIAGRNNLSRGAIQQDFAAGVKELDIDLTLDNDEDADPDEEIRDYDAIARGLPVYCVSSKAYQKQCGRLRKDKLPPGFPTKDSSEIPQLKIHCKQLTESSRINTSRAFLNKLAGLLNSMTVWASADPSRRLIRHDKRLEAIWLRARGEELDKAFNRVMNQAIDSLKQVLHDNLVNYFEAATKAAHDQALSVATGWGAPRALGGLHYMSYKAVVRRDGGLHSGASGVQDFNKALADPIERMLANRWETTFQRRMPKVLSLFRSKLDQVLLQYQGVVEKRIEKSGTRADSLGFLAQQITATRNRFTDLINQLQQITTGQQREASRRVIPVIATEMAFAYRACADEREQGSYNRMKGHMLSHVTFVRGTMFAAATDTVKQALENMAMDIKIAMQKNIDDVNIELQLEYQSIILGGTGADEEEDVKPSAQELMAEVRNNEQEVTCKSNIVSLLNEADDIFRGILSKDADSVEDETRQTDSVREIAKRLPADEHVADGADLE